jgi:ATP-dependent exoDNAse (exonuclease V) beta subunit
VDPSWLRLEVEVSFGLRREGILAEDKDGQAAQSLQSYNDWKTSRQRSIDRGRAPSLNVIVATDAIEPPAGYAKRVQVERVSRSGSRPSGPRFGSLVHLILKDVDFVAPPETISRLARTHARLLNAAEEEIDAAAQAVAATLRHPLLERARRATRSYRELPVVIQDSGGVLEAVIDLAFFENERWIVIDFKTDAEDPQRMGKYRRQVGWYVHSIEKTTGALAKGWILHSRLPSSQRR